MCEATQNQKKVVLVTGASRGIGKAVAERFAREGYAVALHYNTGKVDAEAAVQKLTSAGYTAMAVQADVRDSVQVQQMVDTVSHAWGPIGILINNAGIAQQKLFTDITNEEWHNMFAVHVDGTFYCTRAVLPVMIRQK
ncbi:MAG: SDR family NAD(P)-dependent oxidoreductase, partial [Peptococcaceae bacterium]|nr:SDR family NAD(P)-dependent oxidoreductase [Peptococcaceae bacterium]